MALVSPKNTRMMLGASRAEGADGELAVVAEAEQLGQGHDPEQRDLAADDTDGGLISTAISIVATPTPSGTPPAQMCTASKRSWSTPERSRMDAIRMNISTDARMNSFMKL